jgi:hypothetical protein
MDTCEMLQYGSKTKAPCKHINSYYSRKSYREHFSSLFYLKEHFLQSLQALRTAAKTDLQPGD